MWEIVSGLQKRLINKTSLKEYYGGMTEVEDVDENGKRKREVVDTPASIFKKRGVSSQATINNIFNKSLREDANLEVASFLYNNAIPYHVVKSFKECVQRLPSMV